MSNRKLSGPSANNQVINTNTDFVEEKTSSTSGAPASAANTKAANVPAMTSTTDSNTKPINGIKLPSNR